MALDLNNLNPLHPGILCAKLVEIGPGVLEEKMKMFTDGRTDRRTTGDQTSSLELSPQVS